MCGCEIVFICISMVRMRPISGIVATSHIAFFFFCALYTEMNATPQFNREGDPCALSSEGLELLDNVNELSYLTQVVIRLFEDSQQPGRLRCELSFSPGANNCPYKDNACEVCT